MSDEELSPEAFALWQLNNSFLILAQAGIIETRNNGTEIRVSPESKKWKSKQAPT